MPTAPQPLAPIDPAATGGELVVAAAAALEPDGNAPVGSARTWRVAPAGGGRLQAPSFAQHLDGARSWAGNALAPATRAAYARAWRHFRAWCARHHRPSLPADVATVAAYLDAHTRPRRYQTTTIQLRLTAIGHVHRLAGVGDPTADEQVRVVWKGIRRDPAAPAVSPAKAATGRVLRQVLAAFPDAPLLTVDDAGGNGQADDDTPGGLAADELRERALSDVRDTEEGLRVRVRRSKTDQEGKSRTVGLPYAADPATCPVHGWRAWLARLQRAQRQRGETPAPTDDPAFRPVDRWGHLGPGRLTTRGVRDLLSRRFAAVGLGDGFSPHSLRRGFATGARQGGADLVAIMRHGGWKSAQTVTRYIEEADLFRDNPAGRLGL